MQGKTIITIRIFPQDAVHNFENKACPALGGNYHPIELNTAEKLKQRLDYLPVRTAERGGHENPVRSGLVWEPWHYKYSSAIDYYTNEHGLLKIVPIAIGIVILRRMLCIIPDTIRQI